ncbi:hypothetical protein NDU88_001545 [Pleurodeles waltl]|uniref:Uncharacterized protein n=1 Tax=Pleurodeles waltl TaxID=8319 RepID=A0AAV7NB18_PLEWA|nr:hypothetical protein NDU88_001545 [Pleurodeles waltl]
MGFRLLVEVDEGRSLISHVWKHRANLTPYQSEGRVEESYQNVGDGEVDDEEAGRRLHPLVLDHDVTHQHVPKQGEDDDEGVCHDQEGFHHRILRLRPVPLPVYQAPPVGQRVVIPGKQAGYIRDFEVPLESCVVK